MKYLSHLMIRAVILLLSTIKGFVRLSCHSISLTVDSIVTPVKAGKWTLSSVRLHIFVTVYVDFCIIINHFGSKIWIGPIPESNCLFVWSCVRPVTYLTVELVGCFPSLFWDSATITTVTLKQWTYIPGWDNSLWHELSVGCLQEDHRDTNAQNTNQVRDEKNAWKQTRAIVRQQTEGVSGHCCLA